MLIDAINKYKLVKNYCHRQYFHYQIPLSLNGFIQFHFLSIRDFQKYFSNNYSHTIECCV